MIQTVPYVYYSFCEEVPAQIHVKTIFFEFPRMTSRSSIVVTFEECLNFYIGVAMNHLEDFN